MPSSTPSRWGCARDRRCADRFPTLARHLAVLREAWRRQNDADRDRKPIAEHEFLPAALEIMEKPPSPGLRILMLLLCALVRDRPVLVDLRPGRRGRGGQRADHPGRATSS